MNKPPHKHKKFYKNYKPKPKEGAEEGVVKPERQHRPHPQSGNEAQGNAVRRESAASPPQFPKISREEAASLFENVEVIRQIKTYNELAVGEVERLRAENLMLFEQLQAAQAEARQKIKKVLTLNSEEEPELYRTKVKQLTEAFEGYIQHEKEREALEEDSDISSEDDHE